MKKSNLIVMTEAEAKSGKEKIVEHALKEQHYTTSFIVDQTPEEVFAAINNVRGWWSGEPGIKGNTGKLGDEFTYRYADLHRSTHKITEFVPGSKVVWHTTDSQISFVEDKAEWKGTNILFEIARKGNQTELRFTHVGLIPAVQCYGECSGAWGFYINECLRSLITTGKVPAHEKEQ